MTSRSGKESSLSEPGRFGAGDRKPLAAFQLGFYSRHLIACHSFDEFENILRVLADVILPNPYSELQTLLAVVPEFREKFEPSPTPSGGWDGWTPTKEFKQRLPTVTDSALPQSNTYRSWYDLGRLLGEWVRQLGQGANDDLDVRELRRAIHLLPNQYLDRLRFLKKFRKLTANNVGEDSGLEQALRKAVGEDIASNRPESDDASQTGKTLATRLEEDPPNLVTHSVVISPLHAAVAAFTEKIMVNLQELADLRGSNACGATSDRYARDTWIYHQVFNGTTYAQIIRELRDNRNGWEPIMTPNGIKAAADRYAKRNELPDPPARLGGRPKKPEQDR